MINMTILILKLSISHLLDDDVPRLHPMVGYVLLTTSYGVYICQLILFARAFSYVADFNTKKC